MDRRKVLRQKKREIDAMEFTESAAFLRQIYGALKASLKPYSYEIFSADIGLGQNNMAYLICSGKRQMSRATALKIVRALRMRGLERRYFARLVRMENTGNPEVRDKLFRSLVRMKIRSTRDSREQQQLSLLSDWHHSIVFETLGLGMETSEDIMRRLRIPISKEQVEKSLALLVSLGFVVCEDGRFKRIVTDLDTGDHVPGLNVVAYHLKMIDMAKQALTCVGPQDREVSAVTLSVSEEKAAQIREAIVQFEKYLLYLARESGTGTKVVQVNFQLFPLTN